MAICALIMYVIYDTYSDFLCWEFFNFVNFEKLMNMKL